MILKDNERKYIWIKMSNLFITQITDDLVLFQKKKKKKCDKNKV